MRSRATVGSQLKLGVRASELTNSQIQDIHLSHAPLQELYPELGTHPALGDYKDVIYIPPDRDGNKSKVPRLLPIDEELRWLLIRHLIARPQVDEPWIFLSQRTYTHVTIKGINNTWDEGFHPQYSETEDHRAIKSHFGRHWFSSWFRLEAGMELYLTTHSDDSIVLRAAEKANVPIFKTPLITMKFINLATLALEMMFAPHRSEIGSMVDILGMGVIIKGESGIGKSESVLALIERGYSLVSDDMTRVTLVDGKDVIGTSAEVTRNHMEVRGIGIINVAAMFGVRSIRREKRVDLVVSLKSWHEVPDVDRVGIEEEFVQILGIKIPHVIVPVRPGRDLARLVEVAAFQAKLKAAGVNAAKELNDRLIARMTKTKGD
jgi:HPr kinase/phosphorylase